jgi:hypothetical protein
MGDPNYAVVHARSFQFLVGFRMTDDAHGAWHGCLERFRPQGGN